MCNVKIIYHILAKGFLLLRHHFVFATEGHH